MIRVAPPAMELDPDNPLAIEIRQEMAANYFAAVKKMVNSLEALKAFDLTLISTGLDNTQVKRRTELLEEAAERVLFVLIQREAMNFSGYEKFFEDYEIPHEVRRHLGKSRRH